MISPNFLISVVESSSELQFQEMLPLSCSHVRRSRSRGQIFIYSVRCVVGTKRTQTQNDKRGALNTSSAFLFLFGRRVSFDYSGLREETVS
jgi:hypothetical protein